MKASLTILAILAFAGVTQVQSVPLNENGAVRLSLRGLSTDLDDFIALIPKERIALIFSQYLRQDEDIHDALDYIFSADFKSLVLEIEAIPEMQSFCEYLSRMGLPVYDWRDQLHRFLAIRSMDLVKPTTITGGLQGFIDDVIAVIPVHDLYELYKEKQETSVAFQYFLGYLRSSTFQDLVNKVLSKPLMQELLHKAATKGIRLSPIQHFLNQYLGISIPSIKTVNISRGLREDLDDLMVLIPVDEISDIFIEYFTEDEDFQGAVEYVLSDEFKALLRDVESMPQVKDLLDYLEDGGLHAYDFVNQINDFVGLERISQFGLLRITGGLPGFIADIKSVIPHDRIKELYERKLKESKEFAALVARLKSSDFQKLVDEVIANPKLQDLMKRAEARGVDVQAILDFFTSLLGLKFPHRPQLHFVRGLSEDLDDFMALIPVDKISDIFMEYFYEDEDFQAAVEYVLSDEFKTLLRDVESMPQVKDLLNYLEDGGLHAYEFINKINDLIGLERISQFRMLRITGGLPGFIADIKAVIPHDKIKELYERKLKESKEFAALVARLKSSDFQKLVDEVIANPKLQDLMKRAEARGVDVQAILDFFTSLLGLKFPHRPHLHFVRGLREDLDDFMALIPVDKISDIFMEYFSEDEDFEAAVEYVLSDEFKTLLRDVESMPQVKDLLKYLEDGGLHAYEFINKINDLIGLDRISQFRMLRITGGLPGFIADIKAVIPHDKIKELYERKLKESTEFAALVARLKSSDFQKLVDEVIANPKLQDLMKRAEARGVDVQAILDFFTSLLGLKFPHRPEIYFIRSSRNDEVVTIFKQIWAQVDTAKILDIIITYFLEDPDMLRVVKYLNSDLFKDGLLETEELPEVKRLLAFLYDNGLDVYYAVNAFHGLLEIQKRLPLYAMYSTKMYSTKITGGIPGLFKDIRAVIPVEQLRKFYNNKLETSKKFADFIHRLEEHELQDLVDALGRSVKFNSMLKKLESLGVDLKEMTDTVSSIIGVKFPDRPSNKLALLI